MSSVSEAQPARSRRQDVGAALADVLGVGPGMALLGISFGLLVVHSGLAWWWAPVFSGIVYAGSLEFLLVTLAAAGTPLVTVAAATLLVNGRHVFYALSFPLHRIDGRAGRAYAIFALIDEAYALIAARDRDMSQTRILWTQALLHLSWLGGGLTGAALGAGLELRVPGLDFVFIALFVVLALDAVQRHRDVAGAALAGGCALLALAVAPGQMLLLAMSSFLAVLLVRRRRAGRGSAGSIDA